MSDHSEDMDDYSHLYEQQQQQGAQYSHQQHGDEDDESSASTSTASSSSSGEEEEVHEGRQHAGDPKLGEMESGGEERGGELEDETVEGGKYGDTGEDSDHQNVGEEEEGDEHVEQQKQYEEAQNGEEERQRMDDDIFQTKEDEDDEEGNYENAHQRHEEEEEDEGGMNDGTEAVDEHDGEEQEHGGMGEMERMELSEDEEDEEQKGPTKITVDMVNCRANLGDQGPFFVRLPNFLSIDTKPFDPETYDDELEEDELDEDGKTRLKLKLENTVRWRNVKDEQGNEKKESNAKIVRWSDGSMSLYLGGEIFEIDNQKILDFNHLYIRQGAALQAQSVFKEKLVFRPHSTDTLTHRKMTLNMAEKTNKTQKVRVLAQVGDNPEAQKKELIRVEEEKLRAAARREAQQRRIRDRPRMTGLTPGFLEGYESDEGDSLAAIKRRYTHAPYGVNSIRERSLSDSDEERDERQRARINEAKISSEEEEDAGEGGSDTEQRHRPPSGQQKKKIVIEEDED